MLGLAAFLTASAVMPEADIAHSNRGGLALRLVITGACVARVENDPGAAGTADRRVTVSCDSKAGPPFTVGYGRVADTGDRIVTISF